MLYKILKYSVKLGIKRYNLYICFYLNILFIKYLKYFNNFIKFREYILEGIYEF